MIENGVYHDLSNEEYHSSNGYISSSMLKLILMSSEQYYNKYVAKKERQTSSAAMEVGTAIHAKILEPLVYDQTVVFFDGTRRGKKWDVFKEANEGKLLLGNMQKRQIDLMYKAFLNNPAAVAAIDLNAGKSEVSYFSEICGRKIKVRADYISNSGMIVDLKSTGQPTDKELFLINAQSPFMGYDLQAALYVDTISQALGLSSFLQFCWITLSKADGKAEVIYASHDILESGRRKYREAIQILNYHEATNWAEMTGNKSVPGFWD